MKEVREVSRKKQGSEEGEGRGQEQGGRKEGSEACDRGRGREKEARREERKK